MEILKNLFVNAGWVGYLFNILLAVAVNLDCRARNIQRRKMWTIITLLIPLVGGIVYAIKRKGEKGEYKQCASCGQKEPASRNQCSKCGGFTLVDYKHPKSKMLQTISIVLAVGAIICGIVDYASVVPSTVKEIQKEYNQMASGEDDEEIPEAPITENELYYDANGRAYSDLFDVKFYDKEENTYLYCYDDTDGVYFLREKDNKKYSNMNNCYVDKDGYFYYDSNESVTATDNNTFKDKEGNIYYLAESVTWSYDGTMLVDGEVLE